MRVLVNFDQNLAAEVLFLGFAAGHDALRGGNQDGTTARFDDRDFGGAGVNAAARLRNFGDLGDFGILAIFVDDDMENVARSVLLDFVAVEVAGADETVGDGNFELARRNANFGFTDENSVANAGDKIGDLIS